MSKDPEEKSSSIQIQRLINSKDKGSGRTSNLIAKLFRVILVDLDISLDKYTILRNKWLNNPANHIKNDRTSRATASSNLTKDIIRDTMTEPVLLKLLNILKVESLSVTISLKRRGFSKATEHTVMIEDLPGHLSSRKISRHAQAKPEPKPETTISESSKTLDETTDEFVLKVQEILKDLNKPLK